MGDIDTKGFLFKVFHDWSGGRLTKRHSYRDVERANKYPKSTGRSEAFGSEVFNGFENSLCVTTEDGKHGQQVSF